MVLSLTIKTEQNLKKCLDLLNFVTFKKLQRKSAFLKIAAQVFEAGDFLILF